LLVREREVADEQRADRALERRKRNAARAAAVSVAWRDKRRAARDAAASTFGEVTQRDLFVAGLVAYWAEGSKEKPWRNGNSVDFINSDEGMIRLFIAWSGAIGVGLDRLSFRLSIHETADVEAAQAWWAAVVGVDPSTFLRPTLKRHNPATNRLRVEESYRGCLVIEVRRSWDVYQQIEGWWRALCEGLA
jgi:hypothetical protein